jgi:hypothetical protein
MFYSTGPKANIGGFGQDLALKESTRFSFQVVYGPTLKYKAGLKGLPRANQGILTEGEVPVQLTSLNELVWISSFLFKNIVYETSYSDEEDNRTEPYPLVSVPRGMYYKTFFRQ